MKQSQPQKLIFGYWALRGKPHITRLMMEYLNIPYQQITYLTPQSWYEDPLKKSNQKLELPYIINKDTMIDDSVPVLVYVLKTFGYQNYLGTTKQHKQIVNNYLLSMQIAFKKLISLSLKKIESIEQLIKVRQQFWSQTVQPKLKQFQNNITFGDWYLGYLSVIDFDLHQVVNYVRILYPKRIQSYPKIQQIQKKIAQLPAIKLYNMTQKNKSLCFLPIEMCKRFKPQPQ